MSRKRTVESPTQSTWEGRIAFDQKGGSHLTSMAATLNGHDQNPSQK